MAPLGSLYQQQLFPYRRSRRPTVASNKHFKCDYPDCDKAYYQRDNLITHQVHKHGRLRQRRYGQATSFSTTSVGSNLGGGTPTQDVGSRGARGLGQPAVVDTDASSTIPTESSHNEQFRPPEGLVSTGADPMDPTWRPSSSNGDENQQMEHSASQSHLETT